MRKFLSLSVPILLISIVATAQNADEVIAKHIEAMGGMSKLQAVKSELTIGIADLNGSKIHISVLRKRPNKVREELSLTGVTQIQAYDGQRGWQLGPSKKDPELLIGDDLDDLKRSTDIDGPLVNYRAKGSKVELLGKESTEGADAYNLKVTSSDGKVTNCYVDVHSFLEIKRIDLMKHQGTEEIIESIFGDYKPVDGIMYAYFTKFRKRGRPEETMKIKIDKIELNGPAADSLFAMPSPAQLPANALLNRGDEYVSQKNYDEAIKAYTEAIAFSSNNVVAYVKRGLAYQEKGDNGYAIEDFTQAIRLDSSRAELFTARGVNYSKKGEYEKAIQDFTQAIVLRPDNGVALASRAGVYAEQGNYDRAIQDFREAIRLQPNNFGAYTGRGLAYDKKGDREHAIEDYTQAIRLDPSHAEIFAARGKAYHRNGDNEHAIQDLNVAIRLKPNDAASFFNRCLAHIGVKDAKGAMEDCNEAVRLKPDYAEALLIRGHLKQKMGDQAGGDADVAKARELKPQLPQ